VPSSLVGPSGAPIGVNANPPVPAAPDPTEPIEVTTAFLVYQVDAAWFVSDIDTEVTTERDVTFDDMTAATAVLLHGGTVLTLADDEVRATTAFIVFQLPNGLWQLATQVDAPLMPARNPQWSDLIGGLAVTARDVHTQEIAQQTAQATVNAQFQLGQAVAQQRQQAQVQAQLAAEADAQRRAGRR
jgi:hypothetical protein